MPNGVRGERARVNAFALSDLHQRHLELVLKVRVHPDPTNDDGRTHLVSVVDNQAVEAVHLDPWHVPRRISEKRQPLLGVEERLVLRCLEHRDDEPVS